MAEEYSSGISERIDNKIAVIIDHKKKYTKEDFLNFCIEYISLTENLDKHDLEIFKENSSTYIYKAFREAILLKKNRKNNQY